jgi:hypothetical protein
MIGEPPDKYSGRSWGKRWDSLLIQVVDGRSWPQQDNGHDWRMNDDPSAHKGPRGRAR